MLDDIKDAIVVHCHDGSTGHLSDIVATVQPTVVFHLASLFVSEHGVEDVAPLVHSNVLSPPSSSKP